MDEKSSEDLTSWLSELDWSRNTDDLCKDSMLGGSDACCGPTPQLDYEALDLGFDWEKLDAQSLSVTKH